MSFSPTQLQQVWQKGRIVSGYDLAKYRQDECTAWMQWEEYGNTNSTLGWQVDHIVAVSNQGTDNLANLRPLQHQNNAAKGDGPLRCVVRSNGNQNIQVG